MRLGLVIGLGVLSAVGCSTAPSSGPIALAPTLIAPKALLDGVTRLSVSVYDAAAVKCNTDGTATAGATLIDNPSKGPKALATKDLGTANCQNGARFCGDVQIDPSPSARVFLALGLTSDGKTQATGCSTVTYASSNTNKLEIKMFRLIPQAVCGGKPSTYKVVQCDQPGMAMDPVCDAECLSKEQFLSHGSGNPGQTSSTKNKEKAAFVWPAGSDPRANRFIAFAGDRSQTARTQVSMRVLDPDMYPCVGAKCDPDRGGFVQLNSFFIPNDPNNFDISTQSGDPQSQFNPAAAFANDKYFVAFEDGTGNTTKIALRTIKPDLSAEQPIAQPIALTMGNGQKRPAMAASAAGKIFVAWEANGEIRGRTVDPAACAAMCTLGAETLIGTGTKPSVAGTATGWVVAFQGGAAVKLRAIDGGGAASGSEIDVSTNGHTGNQESPSVAVLPTTGVVGVIWRDSGSGAIYAHRYTSALMPVTGETGPGAQVNDVTKADSSDEPALAAGSGAGGAYFAAAWVDRVTGHVRGRFLDGATGFLFNPVDGQVSEFQVTRTDPSTPADRHNPAIVIGGSSPYVAIGWEDNSGAGTGDKGIFARRFPVPLK